MTPRYEPSALHWEPVMATSWDDLCDELTATRADLTAANARLELYSKEYSAALHEAMDRAERAEAELTHEADCVEAAKAHIAELENTIDLADKHTIMIMAALERAEARVAELEAAGSTPIPPGAWDGGWIRER